MGIKYFKPTSPARRLTTGSDFSEITKTEPEKRLTRGKKTISAHGATGRITVRFRGGAHKRKIRDIEFNRSKLGVPAVVKAIEYDPNRSALIALLVYADGERRYMIAPAGLEKDQTVMSGDDAPIANGYYRALC